MGLLGTINMRDKATGNLYGLRISGAGFVTTDGMTTGQDVSWMEAMEVSLVIIYMYLYLHSI